jgi:hypothetical protein
VSSYLCGSPANDLDIKTPSQIAAFRLIDWDGASAVRKYLRLAEKNFFDLKFAQRLHWIVTRDHDYYFIRRLRRFSGQPFALS